MKRNIATWVVPFLTASSFYTALAHPPDRPPVQIRPSAPFGLQILRSDGGLLPTYAHKNRTYLLGSAGERYTIRVTNPTPQRVEAVVSVDGLDVIDGRPADFVAKRGYIIPAYGEVRIEGFRVSVENVAAFRFSSVQDSYAGLKGKARHVGVIGLAVFAENQPVILAPPAPIYRGDLPEESNSKRSAEDAAPSPGTAGGSARSESAPRALSRDEEQDHGQGRPGLGTQFGERVDSRVMYTQFQRANPSQPSALVELRYNDRAGLIALGIQIDPPYFVNDLDLRETASPFPGSPFSQPPAGW